MQYAGVDTEYGDVPLMDGTTFLLPLRSSLKSCTDDNRGLRVTCARNNLEYTNCHKFRAKTKILTGE
jgi:hypothetical protein